MGKINWDDFWDETSFLDEEDYYKEKKKWKGLRLGNKDDD